jgi:hypothetical protein
MNKKCPICNGEIISRCRCASKIKHTIDDLKNGHGCKCVNNHKFSEQTENNELIILNEEYSLDLYRNYQEGINYFIIKKKIDDMEHFGVYEIEKELSSLKNAYRVKILYGYSFFLATTKQFFGVSNLEELLEKLKNKGYYIEEINDKEEFKDSMDLVKNNKREDLDHLKKDQIVKLWLDDKFVECKIWDIKEDKIIFMSLKNNNFIPMEKPEIVILN